MGISGEKELYDETYYFQLGKLSRIIEGGDYAIFVTGTIMGEVAEAARSCNGLIRDFLSKVFSELAEIHPSINIFGEIVQKDILLYAIRRDFSNNFIVEFLV